LAGQASGGGSGGALRTVSGNQNTASGTRGLVLVIYDDAPAPSGGVPLIGAGGLVY
jgi:hypothetical protein